MKKTQTLYLLILAIVTLTIVSCTNSTKPKNGVITGKVQLDGMSNHSGVSVAIYPAGVVPEKVINTLQSYPQLAFPIIDRTIFDHRNHNSLATVTTDSNGNFFFSNMPYGQYILCFLKEGWGFNYVFDVGLNKSELELSSYNMTLYPEQQIPSFIDGNYVFESNKCYVSEYSFSIGTAAQIEIQHNSRILLGENAKIISLGTLQFPSNGDMAYISSLTGVYSGSINPTDRAEGLTIMGGTNSLHNLSFSHLQNALMISHANVEVSQTIVRDCVYGLTAMNTSDLSIFNCLFIDNKDVNAAASAFHNVNRLKYGNCIGFNNYIMQKHEIVKEAVIKRNAYIDNERGFLNLWESTAVFQNNLIDSQGIGIENSGKSNLEIYYNNIMALVGVKTYHTNNWFNTTNNGWIKSNNNNFFCEKYAVEEMAYYYYPEGPYPLDFINNYWNTTDPQVINNNIFDYNDTELAGEFWISAIVNYNPYKYSVVSHAGIK